MAGPSWLDRLERRHSAPHFGTGQRCLRSWAAPEGHLMRSVSYAWNDPSTNIDLLLKSHYDDPALLEASFHPSTTSRGACGCESRPRARPDLGLRCGKLDSFAVVNRATDRYGR